jgi:uncharacterized Zn-binding protein involved in type VI secretion
MRQIAFLLTVLSASPALASPAVPAAIYGDPVRDPAHPARMEVLHIPSGDVEINGVAPHDYHLSRPSRQ